MDKIYAQYGEQLKNDKDVILTVAKFYDKALAYANANILNDDAFILTLVSTNGALLKYTSDSLRNNENIVLAAIKHKWKALKYASDRLKDNENIVLEAIKRKGNAIKYASNNLKKNRNIVLAAAKNGAMIEYIPATFLNEDEEIINVLVERKYDAKYSLEFAKDTIKNNRALILKALQHNGQNLAFLSEEFKKDIEIVNVAALQNFMALSYAQCTFEELTPIILQNLRNRYFVDKNKLKNIPLNFNKFSVLASIRHHFHDFYRVDNIYKNDKELMLLAIELNYLSYHYVGDSLKLDRDIVMKFLGKYDIDGYFLENHIHKLSSHFKNDIEVLKKISNASGIDLFAIQNYEEYANATTLLGKWFCKLDAGSITKLKKCKSLFYPGAGSDYSTLQFFMENSGVTHFYYTDYWNDNYNKDSVIYDLQKCLRPFDYQIIEQTQLSPVDFNQENWEAFWYPDPSACSGGSIDNSFITKIVIEKEGKTWNLFYFGTEGIATYEVLLKNNLEMEVVVTQDHSLGGCWTSFCNDSLLEKIAKEKRMLPKMILSGGDAWEKFIASSDSFGKFGLHQANRKLYYYKP